MVPDQKRLRSYWQKESLTRFPNSPSTEKQCKCAASVPMFPLPVQLQLHKSLFLPAVWLSLLALYEFWLSFPLHCYSMGFFMFTSETQSEWQPFLFLELFFQILDTFLELPKKSLYTASFQKNFMMMQSNPKHIKNARFREIFLGHSRPTVLFHFNQPWEKTPFKI